MLDDDSELGVLRPGSVHRAGVRGDVTARGEAAGPFPHVAGWYGGAAISFFSTAFCGLKASPSTRVAPRLRSNIEKSRRITRSWPDGPKKPD